MIGGKENLWFLDTIKSFISGLILPEKTWKGIKTISLKFKLLHIFQNFWVLAWRSRHPIALCTINICLNSPLFYTPPALFPTLLQLRIKEYEFLCKKKHRFFIITLSINIPVFFSYTKNPILITYWSFWKGNLTTWDGKITFWKCSSTITPIFLFV